LFISSNKSFIFFFSFLDKLVVPKVSSISFETSEKLILSVGLIGSSGLIGSGLIGSGLIGSGLIGSGLIGSGLIGSGLIGSGLIGSGLIGSTSAFILITSPG